MWICVALLLLILTAAILNRNYKHEIFRKLSIKTHRLLPLYPLCAKVTDIFRKHTRRKTGTDLRELMKSLCVKENVETELYIHQIRKCSVMLFIGICALLCLTLVKAADRGDRQIKNLERAQYGEGIRNYELEVHFRNEDEIMSIDVDQIRLDRSQITELFEGSYDEVYKAMLGSNASAQEVTQPLNLISGYNGFDIFWNIEDTGSVDYNGSIRKIPEDDEGKVVNIYATFSMDDVEQIFSFPVRLVSPVLSEREALLKRIMQEIEADNDAYSPRIALPEELDGDRITFFRVMGNGAVMILILAAAALGAIMLFYDKKLENNVNKRNDQLMMDFSRIVSKLSLLYSAGLSIHGAFERIVSDHEKSTMRDKKLHIHERLLHKKEEYPSDYAYLEMKLALEKIRSGESEGEAYAQFGRRCGLQPYIKLGNLLERNLSKGSKGMQDLLKEEVENAYESRKRLARKKGEQASTKMLIPMTMMLLIVIVIIAFPALLSIGI